METFTEVDFYKAMLNLQVRATQIAKSNCPEQREDGSMSYPVDDGGMSKVVEDINHLERALAILKSEK